MSLTKKKQEMYIKTIYYFIIIIYYLLIYLYVYLRIYSNIKWQISTTQNSQLLLHQPPIAKLAQKMSNFKLIPRCQHETSTPPPQIQSAHIFWTA